MSAHGFSLFDTPIGTCAIAWSGRGIAGLQLPEPTAAATRARVKRRWPGVVEAAAVPAGVQRALDRVLALLAGEAVDLADIPLDLDAAPDFNRRVYEVARTIPPGRTMTYGEIARRLKSVPRAVGQACGRNPYPVVVPCHRVVAADGGLGGFASATGGYLLDAKRWLLAHEKAL